MSCITRLILTVEVDLDAKPTDFLAVSPNGKVPALKFKMQDGSTKGLYESAVIVDYLEECVFAFWFHQQLLN